MPKEKEESVQIELEKENELRIEVEIEEISLTLIDGTAEIFGSEIPVNKTYKFIPGNYRIMSRVFSTALVFRLSGYGFLILDILCLAVSAYKTATYDNFNPFT